MSRLILAQPFLQKLADFPRQEQRVIRDAVLQLYLDTVLGKPPRVSLRWREMIVDDFYSIAPQPDLRVIVYHRKQDYVVLYADNRNAAYAWAVERMLKVHPYTGAMQLVTRAPDEGAPIGMGPRPLARFDADYLLHLGVPEDQIGLVRSTPEETLRLRLSHLPEEVAERLLALLSNELVLPPEISTADPFSHPDAQSFFTVVRGETELNAALSGQWNGWGAFLHPAQQHLVDYELTGPALVTGSAGTGKTTVALHRAVRLAHEGQRVLLTTYSRSGAARLEKQLGQLSLGKSRAHVTVTSVHQLAAQLSEELGLPPRETEDSREALLARMEFGRHEFESVFSADFLLCEWRGVVEARGLHTWEEYREISRVGRGIPLNARQRLEIWNILELFREELVKDSKTTWRTFCDAVTQRLSGRPALFDEVIVDGSQDLGPSELRFLSALLGGSTGALFLVENESQRIYQRAYSLGDADLDFGGRRVHLRLNYRNSQEIAEFAEMLLPTEEQGETLGDRLKLARFSGPAPKMLRLSNEEAEYRAVAEWVRERLAEGLQPGDIAIFTRHVPSAAARLLEQLTGQSVVVPAPEDLEMDESKLSVSSMHRAKGSEYRAVAITGLSASALPSQKRLAEFHDPADQADFIAQERHLLYVAATRAREWLLLTCSGEPSRFLTG